MDIKYVSNRELGRCPAAVVIDGGDPTFLINMDEWEKMPDFSRRFCLAHEIGHWVTGSGSEEAADAFALGLLSGTERKSLKKSLRFLYDMKQIPYERLEALYERCKQIDLKQLNQQKMKSSFFNIKDEEKTNAMFADGGEQPVAAEPKTDEMADKAMQIAQIVQHGMPCRPMGVRVFGRFVSVDSMMLCAVMVAVIVIACKLER